MGLGAQWAQSSVIAVLSLSRPRVPYGYIRCLRPLRPAKLVDSFRFRVYNLGMVKIIDAEIARLESLVSRQMDLVKSYQARQDRIVQGLSAAARHFELGNPEGAQSEFVELLQTDLKQSMERVGNWTMALRHAVAALESVPDRETCAQALRRIADLAPEAFAGVEAGRVH